MWLELVSIVRNNAIIPSSDMGHVWLAAFDRERGLLFVIESLEGSLFPKKIWKLTCFENLKQKWGKKIKLSIAKQIILSKKQFSCFMRPKKFGKLTFYIFFATLSCLSINNQHLKKDQANLTHCGVSLRAAKKKNHFRGERTLPKAHTKQKSVWCGRQVSNLSGKKRVIILIRPLQTICSNSFCLQNWREMALWVYQRRFKKRVWLWYNNSSAVNAVRTSGINLL